MGYVRSLLRHMEGLGTQSVNKDRSDGYGVC